MAILVYKSVCYFRYRNTDSQMKGYTGTAGICKSYHFDFNFRSRPIQTTKNYYHFKKHLILYEHEL